LALALHDVVTLHVVSGGLQVTVEGQGEGEVPLDETHLIVSTMRKAFDAMGVTPGGLVVRCRNAIPHARGMGSSSAAIVAGLWAARASVVDGDERLSNADLLRLATAIEGHPDNVAPCLLGGFTIAWFRGDEVSAMSRTVLPQVRATAFIPEAPVSTELARGLLPAEVPHTDAVFNSARTAILVDTLLIDDGRPADQRAAHLLEATDDRLHQPYRAAAMTASAELVRQLRGEGVAAFISGAGPTVLALSVDGAQTSRSVPTIVDGFTVLPLAIDPHGVRVVDG
jgi:homoserine kinase